jgi:hypothetical protein
MNKVLEIGAYVIACAVALGGGFVGAEMLFAPNNERAESAASVERGAAPADTAEVRNGRFGFSFRYPRAWGDGPRYHASVQESVGRADGVFCYVSVVEKPVAGDATGKPNALRRLMQGFTAQVLERTPIPGATTKVDSFAKATLGEQEARFFVLDAKGGPGATLRQGKLHGYATLRNFGAVFLICVAPDGRYADADVRAAFNVAHRTFRFDQQPH